MKRVAILLGSPLPKDHSHHLGGVKKDMGNYKRFLKSATGGAWRDDEIFEAEDLRRENLQVIKYLCEGADFVIIIYSGHGFMHNGKNYLNVNSDEFAALSELETTAKRQIIIVDACRTNYPDYPGIFGIGITFDDTRPDIARKLYDFYINKSNHGRVILFSSSPNQASQDSRNGGKFTISLLTTTSSWTKGETNEFLPVIEAFNNAKEHIKTLNAQQEPQGDFVKAEASTFPFAVNSKAYMNRAGIPIIEERMLPVQKQSSNAGKVLVVGSLLTAGYLLLRNDE